MKKIVRLPSISNVLPGSIATLELPIGPTYEKLIFDLTASSGLDAADIGRINLLIDGEVVQTYKNLARLNKLNDYNKRDADIMSGTAAQFVIHLNRAELESEIWRAAPGIGTDDVQTFHVEIEIASGAPASIAMRAHALVNPARQKLGAFFRIREFPANSAVAGVFEADKLPRGPWYSVIHLFKSDVTHVEVEANGVKIVDATKEVLERVQKGASPVQRVPQTADATHIDMITNGNLLESLPTANLSDFRVKMTLGTSGAVDIVTETVDTLSS